MAMVQSNLNPNNRRYNTQEKAKQGSSCSLGRVRDHLDRHRQSTQSDDQSAKRLVAAISILHAGIYESSLRFAN